MLLPYKRSVRGRAWDRLPACPAPVTGWKPVLLGGDIPVQALKARSGLREILSRGRGRSPFFPVLFLILLLTQWFAGWTLPAAEPASGLVTNLYEVRDYVLEGKTLLSTNLLFPLFAKHTGTRVSLAEIVRAAADLQTEYRRQGYPTMNIVIAPGHITNGVVPLDVFPGAVEQILVSGKRYWVAANGVEEAPSLAALAAREAARETNAAAPAAAVRTGPKFNVEKYLVLGNTLLPPSTIGNTLSGVTNAYGTNVDFNGLRAAAGALQAAYQARGYVTVKVALPPQKLTNATVKVQVTEGRLSSIEVKGNHYFSSNNVMRALPGLHTNQVLNGLTFQAELNRANASQDRQIYPRIAAGPDPGTSDLTLDVKDRLPLHAKLELNNQSSPGTPDLRVNSSAVYDNLWQLDHSLGIQYSFSPELYKSVPPEVSPYNKTQWDFYDQPLVANYSGFYRLPLGRPESIDDQIASQPGSFGYDEATRKFNLPPPSGQPELNLFASRSTIDTGLATLSSTTLYNTNGNSLNENIVQQDLTENNDLGFRLSLPVSSPGDLHSGVSGGLDFKTFQVTSYKTNVFVLNGQEIDDVGPYTNATSSTVVSPVPVTVKSLQYLPLSLRYDASLRDPLGLNTFGLGLNANLWFSGSVTNVAGSTQSSGHWVSLTPTYSRTFEWADWVTLIRGDGQWTTEPLISNEQFGAGGVNSVRGYREGQVFGDTGWHATVEEQTPAHRVGTVYGNTPLFLRGTVYTDYAETYLLDPQGSPESTSLWGTGFGVVASIGSHWEARFLFSVPLLGNGAIYADQPFFNFSLTAQF